MTEKSPTCILSSACLQGPPTRHPSHRPLVTISSAVDSPSSFSSTATAATSASGVQPARRRSAAADFYSEQQQQQQIQTNPGGVPLLSNNRCSCCPINTLSPPVAESKAETLNADLLQISVNQKNSSNNRSKSSGWKTSKFFSKSMNSGELLKGLKKLTSTSEEQEPPSSSSSSTSKSLKNKLTNFKKRSSCGNEEVSVDVEAFEKLSSSTPSAPTITNKSPVDKSLQDDGIVCKKEDLKAIICSATKRFPLYSPSRKKNALRQTKSASFEPPNDKKKKEPVRRAGSEESKTRKTVTPSSSDSKNSPVISPKVLDAKIPTIAVNNKAVIVAAAPAITTPPVVVAKVQTPEPAEVQVKDEDPTCASTVKWDETNVVDAVLIGDAIESFLKGSMTSSERKVAFRKNSCEKKS